MNAQQVTAVLTGLGIPNYPDRLNPSYTIHADKPERRFGAFIVDSDDVDGPWELRLIGPSTVLGCANNPTDLRTLIEAV